MVTWIVFKNPPLGGRLSTKMRDYGTLNTHNHWFLLFYRVWGPAWIKIIEIAFGWEPGHIWLHTTTWGSVTTLQHEFGGALGRPLVTFFWALTISRSWLLAHVWSGSSMSHPPSSCSTQYHECYLYLYIYTYILYIYIDCSTSSKLTFYWICTCFVLHMYCYEVEWSQKLPDSTPKFIIVWVGGLCHCGLTGPPCCKAKDSLGSWSWEVIRSWSWDVIRSWTWKP